MTPDIEAILTNETERAIANSEHRMRDLHEERRRQAEREIEFSDNEEISCDSNGGA